MDGIDGLAATETITVAGACFLMVSARHGITTVSLLFGLLAAVVLGFLLWNWHPAHVFMGDAGSCFVGYSFVAMALLAAARHQLSLLTPFLLLGVFIIDASMTLIKRMLRREQWYRPHRMHGFQHVSKVLGHRKTTLSVAAINLLWLTPWACLAEFRPANSWLYLACAWLPVIALAHLVHAGEPLTAGTPPRWHSLTAFRSRSISPRLALRASLVTDSLRSSTTPVKVALLAVVSVVSLGLAILTRLEGIGWSVMGAEFSLMLLWTATQWLTWMAFGIHRRQWHLVSIVEIPDLVGITLAGVGVSAVTSLVVMPASFLFVPRAVFVLDALYGSVILIGMHILAASLHGASDKQTRSARQIRVLVYGANAAGVTILSGLRRLCPDYFPVGLVDSRRALRGCQVSGLRVLGDAGEIADLVRLYNIDQVLISSQATDSAVGRRLVASCRDGGIDCRIITSIRDTIGSALTSALDHAVSSNAITTRTTATISTSRRPVNATASGLKSFAHADAHE